MGLFGKREIAQLKEQNLALQNELQRCQALLSPELQTIASQNSEIERLNYAINNANANLQNLIYQANEYEQLIKDRKSQVVNLDDVISMQEYGLYIPRFDFQTVDEYKNALKDTRNKQKELVKQIMSIVDNTNWTVNGNKAQGKKMVRDTMKLLLRAFNGECDEAVRKVKTSNVDATINSIRRSHQAINKLGKVMDLLIPQKYCDLKEKEVRIAYEYARFKEDEKERMRELRAQEREEAKLRKEIEEERKKLEKERRQNQKALDDILKRIDSVEGEEKQALLEKKAELENTLGEIAKANSDIDYREANQRAGYVYIISNIGSFGEGVYKIGMTRRLDPMDRIMELSDASVPFNFDVHALIFTEDAPGLENALHHEFENQKVNKVNQRREFFRVSLDDIKRVVKENYDQTVEFYDTPEADQYRTTLKMEAAGK